MTTLLIKDKISLYVLFIYGTVWLSLVVNFDRTIFIFLFLF